MKKVKNIKKPNWSDVWDIVTQQVDIIINQQILAQGWAKNIRVGGDFSEVHFRSLLEKIVPQGFGITSGHIIAKIDRNQPPIVSPQCDIIIYDKMVPHSLLPFKQEGVSFDFVPIEAVVAIFETKTTLYNGKTKNSLFSTCQQIKDILQAVNLNPRETGHYLPGGIKLESQEGFKFDGGKSANPLIGILSCKTVTGFLKKSNSRNYLDEITKLMDPYRLDIALSMDGQIICPSSTPDQFMVDPRREMKGVLMKQTAGMHNPLSRSQVVARGLAIILLYLQGTSGRHLNPADYLFY